MALTDQMQCELVRIKEAIFRLRVVSEGLNESCKVGVLAHLQEAYDALDKVNETLVARGPESSINDMRTW